MTLPFAPPPAREANGRDPHRINSASWFLVMWDADDLERREHGNRCIVTGNGVSNFVAWAG